MSQPAALPEVEIPAGKAWQRAMKRLLDLAGASAGLVLASPVMSAVALAIWRDMGGPVLYRQTRVGQHERTFRLWKFRTMTDERDTSGELLPDAQRLTPLGRTLRRWSLDELPQFLNVLAGEMSLVGPRPLLVRYLPRYSSRQRLRHRVKPGLTGWAQVNGRNALDWESRLELDVEYAERFSLALDARIVLRSIAAILNPAGIKAGAGAELDEFWGAAGPPAEGPRAFPVEADEVAK